MERRAIVVLAAAVLTAPRLLFAQQAKRVYRIAILDGAAESGNFEYWQLFRNRLRELVLAEGRDVAYEAHFAGGNLARLPALAAELVAGKPDLIASIATPSTSAAVKATSKIPVVFVEVGDPVSSGFVASLSRPGGNVTGSSIASTEVIGKSLELLHELAPGVTRIGYLTDVSNTATALAYRQLEKNARALMLSVQMFDGGEPQALERSLATMQKERVQGLIMGFSAAMLKHRDQLVQFAARERLPAVYARREYVDAGGLLHFAADRKPMFLRGAQIAHQILTGTKPAEIPVELPSTFVVLLNLKTAGALGIKIPESVRVRVTEVIQ